MTRRNRRKRANERRRKSETYESKSELGSDDESELSREDSYPPTDAHKNRSNPPVAEAQVQQLQNKHNQIEIKVESSISNSNNAQHTVVHQRGEGEVNTLYRAALRGDWKAIEAAMSLWKNTTCIKITERGDMILHIAAAAKQTAFVHNLVERLNTSDLELKNTHGNTAFCFAAVSGVVEIAKVMYENNKNLPTIRSSIGKTPLERAVLLGNRKMVEYLYPITPLDDLIPEEIRDIFLATIHTDMYDMSLKILKEAQTVIFTSTENIVMALQVLARKPLSHNHRSQGWIWERLVSIITTIPCVSSPPSRLNIVSGAALQMQRELLWFKVVEKIVQYPFLDMKNDKKQTPRELFSEEHRELRKDGEKWMTKTASSCMVVATLIATVAFAAAFTVPGGNNERGTPVFLKNRWFTVFVISDAVALFSSATSIMMFLSILTSRYTEDDFLFSLPLKLMVGLISLFASIVCVVLTFSATFFLVYNEEKHGPLPRLVAALAWLPIIVYAVLNHRLGIALIHSTCRPAVLMFRPGKHRLY